MKLYRVSRFHPLSCLFYIMVLQCRKNIATSVLETTASTKPSKESSVDPGIALGGSCVVVCDASPIPFNDQTQSYYRPTSKEQPPRKVAFLVSKNDASSNGVENPTIVDFDYYILNIGHCFDIHKDRFKASANGIYSFDFTIFKLYNRNSLTVALTVNGEPIFTAFADANVKRHEMAQNSGLIHLVVGDIVRIEILDGHLNGGWQYSTFSGHLLFEDSY